MCCRLGGRGGWRRRSAGAEGPPCRAPEGGAAPPGKFLLGREGQGENEESVFWQMRLDGEESGQSGEKPCCFWSAPYHPCEKALCP